MDRPNRWVRLTGDGLVTPTPCNVHAILQTPTINVRGTIRVYDGSSASDPLIATLVSYVTQTSTYVFTPPLHCLRGLYIDFVTTNDEVTVLYDPQTK